MSAGTFKGIENAKVLVLRGGFAGLYAAIELNKLLLTGVP
jgi:monoamine oxidase